MESGKLALLCVVAATATIMPLVAKAVPTISSVSFISTQQLQTITLLGSGFGTASPYIGTSNYIQFQDITRLWSAGYQGLPCPGQPGACLDSVTLRVNSWTDSRIEIGGFAGAWGASNYTLANGDLVKFLVSNPQSGISIYTSAASISAIVGQVPEPSSYALMMLGVGFIAATARRSFVR